MAAYCAEEELDGFANFFIVQAEEERFHAMKFFTLIGDLGQRPIITGFEDPKNEFSSVQELFELALEHEQFVTKRIHMLMDMARQENHHQTVSFLQWFIDEQVEEEANMSKILRNIKRVGGEGYGILLIDQELAGRIFTPPAQA
ncbi:MAG: ferritin [Clostridiales bacterium]|jgi:ferritin|nr:ferritin [Clostridiales bacterium]